MSRLAKELHARRAHWVSARTFLWDADPRCRIRLHAAAEAGLERRGDAIVAPGGVEEWELVPDRSGPPPDVVARFPHLSSLPAWTFAARESVSPGPDAARLLRGQLALSAVSEEGRCVAATGIQVAGVLDDLFATDAPLGLIWSDRVPSLHLWAPTARAVRLLFFSTSRAEKPEIVPMARGPRGVWSVDGEQDWRLRYYLYEVEVYAPSTGGIVTNRVTDPYSRSLSLDSRRSQIVDLDDPALQPRGWRELRKPALPSLHDTVLYELHLRDFSALDASTPAHLRGTYLAFTIDSAPTRHLRRLADAGVTHVHLLPIQDFATVDDDRNRWQPIPDLTSYPPDSEEPQAIISALRHRHGYNWGYDPFHFGVPEGSYSVLPDGPARVYETRRMVQSLARFGLRVILDVVYNHTFKCGQSARATLDRIVPGYYHRLDDQGRVTTSTCCANTASEHRMMERLIGDDLVHWARDYKVDGFRFDLMGHHMKRNLLAWRDLLRALEPGRDGVDGKEIYLYGEGWDFGEVEGGRRGENASQKNMAGTGVGTFNDRMRDAVRGGSPFSDRRSQGFVTGLYTAPAHDGNDADARDRLGELSDRLRIALAGNLADFRFTDRHGQDVRAGDVHLGGYAHSPLETVQYVSAHDNETLFDKIVCSTPWELPLEERIRLQVLALALVALAQGVPFFHAGSEILRSKSCDADSYQSGDWFNQLDFTGGTHGFGRGLPPAKKNRDRWEMLRPLLARRDLVPTPEQILATRDQFETFLRIRRSSSLFRLKGLEEIQSAVRFLDGGSHARPGWIVFLLSGRDERLCIAFHAGGEEGSFSHADLTGRRFVLHPLLEEGPDARTRKAGFDPGSGTVHLPARTAAVFVERACRSVVNPPG